jgi:hypothetical protein
LLEACYELAYALRELRHLAGTPPYRNLARETHFSAAALSAAASGRRLPTLELTLAYVKACRGDVEEFTRLWHDVRGRATAPAAPAARVPSPGRSASLDARLDDLADAVFHQWSQEEMFWRLADPGPLPVRWQRTALDVADHDELVFGASPPETFSGMLDDVADLFSRLPARRLVVLGEPGAGKTVMAVRMALELLNRRTPGSPVPVVVPLSSWMPAERPLSAWLANQLVTTYPALGAHTPPGGTLAEYLFRRGFLIPILDGFDELPSALRPAALRGLNGGLPRGCGVVVTARGDEYRDAVHHPEGDVLTASAVVELLPLSPEDTKKYLRDATAPHRVSQWEPVFAHLSTAADGALAQVLSSPLMVWLTRVTYADNATDPGELLAERFASGRAIDEHLVDGLVSAAHQGGARQWLGFLARHLGAVGTSEIAWWQLERAVPRWVMGLLGGTVFGVLLGLSISLSFWPPYGPGVALDAGLAAFVIAAVSSGLVIGMSSSTREFVPTVVRFQKPPWPVLRRAVLESLALGTAAGAATASVVALLVGSDSGIAEGASTAIAVGVPVAVAMIATRMGDVWFIAPADIMRTVDPLTLLRADRASAMTKSVIGALSFGLAFGLPRGLASGVAAGLAAGLSRLLVGELDQGFRKSGHTAWSRFVLARTWLALRRKLPWRVFAFLQHAHRRHLLRQTGSTYQFRHHRLQTALSDSS